ncbi:hypothetical protein Rhopal_001028-T1 [Rhodotorula paludigena]|uniref:Peptidase S54 rhomboid domain-containing protein n=1 Tax=Rhodotorula paludigena TaxID=86838 RepID=A0AAV5GG60_9BASI|nr:hypothetical protein Rhopal_001028-T1 [Rhodotorula paludigena]
MSTGSFAGAPLSKALVTTLVVLSVAAAITATQQYLNVPLHPHLSRDHQLYRLALHHVAFANSAELVLAIFCLWQTSIAVERIFGTRKFASFLVVTTALSTFMSALTLLLASRLTRGRFNALPAGPFAITFAIIHQSYRLVPSLYRIRLFHPALTFTNRFPLYLLASLLLFSQPPASLLQSLIGLASSQAWTSNLLHLQRYRLSRRTYRLLSSLGALVFHPSSSGAPPAEPRRGTAVTPEEAMLHALAGQGAAAGGASGFDATALRLALRTDTGAAAGGAAAGGAGAGPGAGAAEPVAAGAAEGGTGGGAPPDADAAADASAPAVPAATRPSLGGSGAERPMPRVTGASFLQQWTAGLTGAPDGPTPEQIAELSSIFPATETY